MQRREFLKDTAMMTGAVAASGILGGRVIAAEADLPVVWHWKECSPENLLKALGKIRNQLSGNIAVKLHSGEPHGPNILPPAWVKELVTALPGATAVECNVLYNSPRKTTEGHRKAMETNGWGIPIDIMDADGDTPLPVDRGFHLKEVAVGKNLLKYDSLLILTHFKGHAMGGFGGSLKNIAIGCASGRLGKAQVHGVDKPGAAEKSYLEWPMKEWFMEAMADSGKAITNHFKGRYACINVLRRMSVDCDCAGVAAEEPTIADIGICASTDILAIDQACCDMVFTKPEGDQKDLVERITSRHGLHQLTAMREQKMGNPQYELIEVE